MKLFARYQGLARLLTLGRRYSRGFATAFVLLVVATGFEMASPWVMKIILDQHIVTGSYSVETLALLGATLIATYVGAAVFQYLQSVVFNDNALEVIHDIRQQMFQHLLTLPMRYFDSEPVGRLVSRLTNDSDIIRQMYVAVLPAILRSVVKMVGIFIALAMLDLRLMLLMVLIVPMLLVSMHLYQKYSHPVVHGVREKLADINTLLGESLVNMGVIQAANREQTLMAAFSDSNRGWRDFRKQEINVNSLFLMPFSHLVQTLSLAGIVGWFGWKAGFTTVEVGTVYAFVNYLTRFFDPFRQVAMQLGNLQQALVASERVFAVLAEPSEIQRGGALAMPTTDAAAGRLEFRHVSLSYDGRHRALDDVSFVVEPGQFIAVVGQSGSGKSSLINVLMRFYPTLAGEVLVDDQPLGQIDEAHLRESIGLVFQEPYIFTGTLIDNITLGNGALSVEQAQQAAEKVHASRFINKLSGGYDHIPAHGGQSLSIGERQLLSFARTVAQNPRILLLDEATANIDGETEHAIKEALITLREGRTTVAIAHRLSTIQDADQILVMDKGRIIQRGTHSELIHQSGAYRDLYLAQQMEKQLQSA